MNSLKTVEKIGIDILNQMKVSVPPKIEIPKRFRTNVIFDKTDKTLRIGNEKFVRHMTNLGEIKSFTQTLTVASIIADSLREDTPITKRDIYYTGRKIELGKTSLFEDQKESDLIIEDVEVLTGMFREQLGIVAEESGQIIGNIKYEMLNIDDEWVSTNCNKIAKPDTTSGEYMTDKFRITDVGADFVLVIEKGGILEKLASKKLQFHRKHNCIMLSTKGQPDRASRYLVRKLNKEYKLPIYILTDGDPWGMHIASVWKYGSIRLCYENERLATPDANVIGVFPSDIEKYNIKGFEKLDVVDTKRARRLMNEPWLELEPKWKEEIELFLKNNKKCEIENLSEHGITFLTDTYLPDKLSLKR